MYYVLQGAGFHAPVS